jgi:hypothetical protein
MKRGLLICFVAFCASGADGQVVTAPAKPRVELEAAAPVAAKTNLVSTNALPLKGKATAVTYSGVAADVRKATNRWRVFSLRRPLDPKEDGANWVRDLGTEGGGGVKIFSVDF